MSNAVVPNFNLTGIHIGFSAKGGRKTGGKAGQAAIVSLET